MGTMLVVSGRHTGAALAVLGLLLIALAAAVPFVASAPLLAFILMSVPALCTGVIALIHGLAVMPARLAITDSQLELAVPGWRVFPVPPVRKLTVRWDELLAVRRRTEVYQLLGVMPFPVDAFAIETTKGSVVMGGRSLPGLRTALAEIAARAGLAVQDEGVLELGMVRTLLKGPPPFGFAR